MSTQKCLIAYDPKRPLMRARDYLAPIWEDGQPKFFGMKSGATWELGRAVYLTMELTVDEMFISVDASGQPIDDEDQYRGELEAYLEMCQHIKMGSVVELHPSHNSPAGFELVETNIKPFGSAEIKLS